MNPYISAPKNLLYFSLFSPCRNNKNSFPRILYQIICAIERFIYRQQKPPAFARGPLLMYTKTKGIRFTNLAIRLVQNYSTSCKASISSSPVRILTTFATSYTKIFHLRYVRYKVPSLPQPLRCLQGSCLQQPLP